MDPRGKRKMKRTTMVIKTKTNLLLNNNVEIIIFLLVRSFAAFICFCVKKGSAEMKWEHKRQMNASILQCNQVTTQLWYAQCRSIYFRSFGYFRSSCEQNERWTLYKDYILKNRWVPLPFHHCQCDIVLNKEIQNEDSAVFIQTLTTLKPLTHFNHLSDE